MSEMQRSIGTACGGQLLHETERIGSTTGAGHADEERVRRGHRANPSIAGDPHRHAATLPAVSTRRARVTRQAGDDDKRPAVDSRHEPASSPGTPHTGRRPPVQCSARRSRPRHPEGAPPRRSSLSAPRRPCTRRGSSCPSSPDWAAPFRPRRRCTGPPTRSPAAGGRQNDAHAVVDHRRPPAGRSRVETSRQRAESRAARRSDGLPRRRRRRWAALKEPARTAVAQAADEDPAPPSRTSAATIDATRPRLAPRVVRDL